MQISSQSENNQESLIKQIKEAKFQIHSIDSRSKLRIRTGNISNDLKYIALVGSDQQLRILNYKTNYLFKSIRLNYQIQSCTFTIDSQLLYVAVYQRIIQFFVNKQFKKICQLKIHDSDIINIRCISSILILTSSLDHTIIKTNVNNKQQLLKIYADDCINAFDYNEGLNLIAGASQFRSIKLFNLNNGNLQIEKLNAHNCDIRQILFIIKTQQLISSDEKYFLIIWNLNLYTKKLEQYKVIKKSAKSISLVLNQLYIIATGNIFIRVYTNQGDLIREFRHHCDEMFYENSTLNTMQPNSMKAILMLGYYTVFVCKIVFQ